MAQAVLFALENTLNEHLYNVGTGVDLTIKELAHIVQKTVGHSGRLEWDLKKPDGTPRKLMDNTRLNNQGWKSKIDLQEGIEKTYNWYLNNV